MSDNREGQDRRIRERAYRLWEQEGRPHGVSDDHWHRARHEVGQEDERSGSLDDRLAGGLTDPAEASTALPAAPEDEPAPAISATLEEAPGEAATAQASPKPKPARPAAARAPKPAAAKPLGKPPGKPRKNPVG